MKMIFLTILFALCIVVLRANISYQNINVKDGLSQTTVHSICRDTLGRMWFGTQDGLNCFDGNRIRVFRAVAGDTTTLFANNIEEVLTDGKEKLYLRCKNGIMSLDLKSERFQMITDKDIFAIHYKNETLWAGSRNKLLRYNFASRQFEPICTLKGPASSHITIIEQCSDGRLFVGTLNSGLWQIKGRTAVQIIPDIGVYRIFHDSRGAVWVGTRSDGLYCISSEERVIHYSNNKGSSLYFPSPDARSIVEDDSGNIYCGSLRGLYRLNAADNTFEFINIGNSSSNWSNNSVLCLTKDSYGTIWAGMYYGGVSYFNPEQSIFKIYQASGLSGGLSSSNIGIMTSDRHGNILVCTESGGLNYFDPRTKIFTPYRYTGDERGPSSNIIKTAHIDQDDDNVVWIGTAFASLTKKTGGRFSHIKNSDALFNPSLYSVRKIGQLGDTLFLGTHMGLLLYDKHRNKFLSPASFGGVASDRLQILDMIVDHESRKVWCSNSRGLFCLDIKTNSCAAYDYQTVLGHKNYNNVNTLYLDMNGDIILGTTGEGLFIYTLGDDKFNRIVTGNNSIDKGYIIAYAQSVSGNTYVATNDGLFIINKQSGKISHLNHRSGFPLETINPSSLFIDDNRDVYVGGISGLVIFNEAALNYTPKKYSINITNAEIDNEPYNGGQCVPFLDKIYVGASQKSLSVEFAATNYLKNTESDYQYRLLGFETKWITAEDLRRITYTNLAPGKYALQIKSVQEGNVVAQRQIEIFVRTPFYRTAMAILIYILLIIGTSYLALRSYASRVRLRSSLELEKSKQNFFINISHEFRTPITLITGYTESLLQMTSLSFNARKKVQAIYNSAQRTNNIINELMDFGRIESGSLTLRVSKVNLIPLLYNIYINFKEYAIYRHIDFQFVYTNEQEDLWVDAEQIEKVFYNIISNAFNYTNDLGCITLSVQGTHNYVYVRIEDSGIGIAEDQQEKIFEHYYRIGNDKSSTLQHIKGSGIGLFYAQSIVELHSGRISVSSTVGQGSVFTVELSRGHEHLKNVCFEYDVPQEQLMVHSEMPDADFFSKIDGVHTDGKKITVLIIEDNKDILNMLIELLSPLYNTITACNGQQGLSLALKHQPDLIMSDVMMPGMNGIDMCQRIKSDSTTSHIPVILLTAKAAVDYKIEGLNSGADDYITKPFNTKELIARCNNIITNRHILHRRFLQHVDFAPEVVANNSIDMQFMDNIYRVVEENISKSDLSIEALCRSVSMGRTNLHAKIKALTGMTPNDLVLNIRLKRAMELVMRTKLNTSEIAYDTGFNSSSYFIKCFKRVFGQTPSEVRKRENE